MAEVLLSTNDLTVLGGPTTVNVETDFGGTGQRGSLIYASNGDPRSPNSGIPTSVLPYDIAINISASSTRYLTVYQYFSADGVNDWRELTRLSPNAGSVNLPVRFINGTAHMFDELGNPLAQPGIAIPVASITENITVTPANFNIQYAIENTLPMLTSMQISPTFVVVNNISYLAFVINAYQINPLGTPPAVPLDAVTTKIHLFITVV